MSDLSPPLREPTNADTDHLRLLAIFHFIIAGLSLLGLGFLFAHYAFMGFFLNNPEMWKHAKEGPPPPEVFGILKWFYAFFGAMIIGSGIGNFLSGWFISKRKHRVFSLIVAGLDCMQFPFGTALGVFTFVVLLRDSVRRIYTANTNA
jgi:hypothetical protein